MTICVYGLGHQGSVVAACLASSPARYVLALEPTLAEYSTKNEPGLRDLGLDGIRSTRLEVASEPSRVQEANLVWVTYDTPVEDDKGDPDWVRAQLELIRPWISDYTLILMSSQVPVGFTAALEKDWQATNPTLSFAYSPENLRHGHAIEDFMHQERVVVGLGRETPTVPLMRLFFSFTKHIEWMSLGAAEMSKHALNGFLAISAVYANELSRLCERTGVDYDEVERALRTEPRIGRRAYVAARGPIEGSLLRDIEYLIELSRRDLNWTPIPVIDSVQQSNEVHRGVAQR